MLQLRPEQFDTFERTALAQFEDEMVAHLQQFHPPHAAAAGGAGLRRLIRAGVDRARGYGFTLRGPVRFYLEQMTLFGHTFDTDPLLPWVAELRRPGGAELARADQIHAAAAGYYDAVVGPDGEVEQRAIRRLLATPVPVWLSGDSSDAEAGAKLRAVYPEKCDAAGPAGVRAVVAWGRQAAWDQGLGGGAGGTVFAALALALGHGVLSDPQYPWVADHLRETAGQPPGVRTEKLATRAVAFLTAVLAEHERG